MKKFLLSLATAASLAGGMLATSTSAQAFTPHPGWHPGHHGMRDPGWRHPGWRPGFYPGHVGGGYWGGHRIFIRPVYSAAYEDCEWVRVRTPWGPRWRNVC